MKLKTFVNFIIDKRTITIGLFLNTIVIIIFFHLSVKKQVDIFFPIAMSIFIYVLVMIIEWNKYYELNKAINIFANGNSFYIVPKSIEQEMLFDVISKVNQKHLDKVSELSLAHRDEIRFISQWIHNMKTPVSVINLALQQETIENHEDTKKVIEEENLKIHANLDLLLNMIRFDDFSSDYVPEVVDLLKSVKSVINSRRNQFIYNKIFPKLICEDENILILSDSKWTEVIIEQIISNSIKYSVIGESASKMVSIKIVKEGRYTSLFIKDEGIGIPEYDLEKVFEPFFTGENGRKAKSSSGIGLYLCKSIAEKLGHKISITSKIGEGTEVKISFLSKM